MLNHITTQSQPIRLYLLILKYQQNVLIQCVNRSLKSNISSILSRNCNYSNRILFLPKKIIKFQKGKHMSSKIQENHKKFQEREKMKYKYKKSSSQLLKLRMKLASSRIIFKRKIVQAAKRLIKLSKFAQNFANIFIQTSQIKDLKRCKLIEPKKIGKSQKQFQNCKKFLDQFSAYLALLHLFKSVCFRAFANSLLLQYLQIQIFQDQDNHPSSYINFFCFNFLINIKKSKLFYQKQKKIMNYSELTLPKINRKQIVLEQDEQQVAQLDQWSNNIPKVRSKNINIQNISQLYKANQNQTPRRSSKLPAQKLTEVNIFLVQLNNDLNKIKNIDYESIHRNIEYCSGFYENQFNGIFKKLQQYKENIQKIYKEELKHLQEKRQMHIKLMQNPNNQQYKQKIRQVREYLEDCQEGLKPLKKMIKTIALKREIVLKFCLSLGYDVRNQGLVWILKELKRIPKISQFPTFLSEQQISYIVQKYQNYLTQQAEIEVQKQNYDDAQQNLHKTYEKIARKKRRELSTIKEQQILAKMQQDRAQSIGDLRKYLDQDTLKMLEQVNCKVKATKYEIIYSETNRKLSKICHDKIHGIKKPRKSSKGTLEMIDKFNSLLYDTIAITQKQQTIRNVEQKQMNEIIKNLRMQKYQDNWKKRNPITIISCLIGWKKTKKLIEQQFNIFL